MKDPIVLTPSSSEVTNQCHISTSDSTAHAICIQSSALVFKVFDNLRVLSSGSQRKDQKTRDKSGFQQVPARGQQEIPIPLAHSQASGNGNTFPWIGTDLESKFEKT